MSIRALPAVALLALVAGGCSTLPDGLGAPSRKELSAALVLPPGVTVTEIDLLGITPEMRQFVRDTVPHYGSETRRLDSLMYALRHPGVRRIAYDAGANLGAAEAFEQRRANCLSFAALFVALAREVGFRASFQKVDVAAQWERLDNDLLVRLQHVNTVVEGSGRLEHTIEFQRPRFNMSMPREPISDAYALALAYNNLGSEYLFAGDLSTARAYLIHAIRQEATIAPAWVNLGVVHRREHNMKLAEVSYRQALRLDPSSTVAMNNLAALLEMRGERQLAEALRDRAHLERWKNPQYHYALARHAYNQQQYDQALEHLTVAMKRTRRDHNFLHLMALIMHAMGDEEQALRSLKLATKNATDDDARREYRATLASWQKSAPGI